MKKASKILLIIGGILAIIVGIVTAAELLLAAGIESLGGTAMVVLGIVELAMGGEDYGMAAVYYFLGGGLYYLVAIICLVTAVVLFFLYLLTGIFSLISGGKKAKMGLNIVTIIFAVLTVFANFSVFSILVCIIVLLGSIFSIVARNKEKKEAELAEQQPEVIEVK